LVIKMIYDPLSVSIVPRGFKSNKLADACAFGPEHDLSTSVGVSNPRVSQAFAPRRRLFRFFPKTSQRTVF
jgi:hypothetical protein